MEEEEQTANLPDIAFYRLGFITKSGFADNVDIGRYNTFTLTDFYR